MHITTHLLRKRDKWNKTSGNYCNIFLCICMSNAFMAMKNAVSSTFIICMQRNGIEITFKHIQVCFIQLASFRLSSFLPLDIIFKSHVHWFDSFDLFVILCAHFIILYAKRFHFFFSKIGTRQENTCFTIL